MWVRSQDKKTLIDCQVFEEDYNGQWQLIGIGRGTHTVLGVYTFEEEVLNVLNDIQCEISSHNFGGFVYEMPLEAKDLGAIEDLNLSVRSYRILKQAKLNTIKAVKEYERTIGIQRLVGMGTKTYKEIIEKLNDKK